jgi:predicted aspartyl protease
MGMTYVEVQVGNPSDPSNLRRVEFMIDSGAIDSVAPRRLLEELGIKPIVTEKFFPADGKSISRDKGIALLPYGARVGGADVLFGEEGDANLLGATTLEALALSLDPLRRELNPMLLPLGGFFPSKSPH